MVCLSETKLCSHHSGGETEPDLIDDFITETCQRCCTSQLAECGVAPRWGGITEAKDIFLFTGNELSKVLMLI